MSIITCDRSVRSTGHSAGPNQSIDQPVGDGVGAGNALTPIVSGWKCTGPEVLKMVSASRRVSYSAIACHCDQIDDTSPSSSKVQFSPSRPSGFHRRDVRAPKASLHGRSRLR